FAAGGFSATSATAPDASFAVGMTSGINEKGELQLGVRQSVITQTSLTGGSTETPTLPTPGATLSNTTFLDYNRDGYLDYVGIDTDWGSNAQPIFTGQPDGTHVGHREWVGQWTAGGGIIAFDKEGDGY